MQSTYLDTNGLSITCGMETLLLANVIYPYLQERYVYHLTMQDYNLFPQISFDSLY
jgi:hypothetical protein